MKQKQQVRADGGKSENRKSQKSNRLKAGNLHLKWRGVIWMFLLVSMTACNMSTSEKSGQGEAVSNNMEQVGNEHGSNEAGQDDDEFTLNGAEQPDDNLNKEEENRMRNVCEGPYGQLSVLLSKDWESVSCPVDSETLYSNGDYGLILYPKTEDSKENRVEITVSTNFGICGTGLEQKTFTLSGKKARAGYYDGKTRWDFICFEGEMDGVVVYSYGEEEWWKTYEKEVMEMLDTISFDKNVRSGAIGIYEIDSEQEIIGLFVSVKRITEKGAVLCFQQYDEECQGELSFGEDLTMEQKDSTGNYIPVPVVVEGGYGFNDLAHLIEKNGVTEYDYDWEWLYGNLKSGEYRIRIPVSVWEEGKTADQYILYAYFLLFPCTFS